MSAHPQKTNMHLRHGSHHSTSVGNDDPVGYAILGTANIARKYWKAIHMSGCSRIVCVASRSLDKAQAFIDECQGQLPFKHAPEPVEGYEAALNRDDVQVVYIPLPTALRKEWVLKAAEKGKHILVEKPVAINEANLREMIDATIKHHVHMIDGVMFMHSHRLPVLHHSLQSLGKLRRINTEFTFKGDEKFFADNIRCSAATEPLGALGDLGWYNIRFTLWAKDWYLPTQVRGHIHAQSSEGVPYEVSGEMLWEDGTSATFFCSFLTHETQLAKINGEKASIEMNDFVLPLPGRYLSFDKTTMSYTHEGLDQVVYRMEERINVPEAAYGHPSAQESQMIRHISDLAREGLLETTKWPEYMLKTITVLDAVMASATKNGGGWVEMEGGL